jgi:hypothetical protein
VTIPDFNLRASVAELLKHKRPGQNFRLPKEFRSRRHALFFCFEKGLSADDCSDAVRVSGQTARTQHAAWRKEAAAAYRKAFPGSDEPRSSGTKSAAADAPDDGAANVEAVDRFLKAWARRAGLKADTEPDELLAHFTDQLDVLLVGLENELPVHDSMVPLRYLDRGA